MNDAGEPRRHPIPRASVRPFFVLGVEPFVFGVLVAPIFPILGLARLSPQFVAFAICWCLMVLPVGALVRRWDPRGGRKYLRYRRLAKYYRPVRPFAVRKGRA